MKLASLTLLAHGPGGASHEGSWWTAWNWNQPIVVVNLSLLTLVYTAGLIRLWSRVGAGKTMGFRRAACFAAGIVSLFVALVCCFRNPYTKLVCPGK